MIPVMHFFFLFILGVDECQRADTVSAGGRLTSNGSGVGGEVALSLVDGQKQHSTRPMTTNSENCGKYTC